MNFDSAVALIIAVQNLGAWLEIPMRIFSFLGTEIFYLLILPVLYWCIDANLGLRVGVILLFSGAVNEIFKLAFGTEWFIKHGESGPPQDRWLFE